MYKKIIEGDEYNINIKRINEILNITAIDQTSLYSYEINLENYQIQELTRINKRM